MSPAFKINRAPVMALWAAVVAERLGFDWNEALTLGKVVTGLNAQAKGQRLGIFEPAAEAENEAGRKARQREQGEVFFIDVLGRPVPAVNTPEGVRGVNRDKPVTPKSVERYLEGKFGDNLDKARSAMEALAKSYPPRELAGKAYTLYEKFRPEVPEGTKGWGAAGELDLEKLKDLAKV
jgi:hypothetical protein